MAVNEALDTLGREYRIAAEELDIVRGALRGAVRRAAREGQALRAIARVAGVSQTTVHDWTADLDIPGRRKP